MQKGGKLIKICPACIFNICDSLSKGEFIILCKPFINKIYTNEPGKEKESIIAKEQGNSTP
jgi:hypothetical protein